MKIAIIVIIGLVVLMGVGFGIRILFFPVHTLEKEIELAYDAQDKILDADNAIYNYEWFKQRYEDIEATTKKLNNARTQHNDYLSYLPADRTLWDWEDKQEDSRQRSVVLGLQNHLEQLIADYNARAKMATRNIFEDSVLPDYIDALTFIRQ